MDTIKTEIDRKYTLCQGCLSSDRKITRIAGPSSSLFLDLIGDQKHNLNNTRDILLCWECRALLHKLQLFQRRIQNAQYVLIGYLQSFAQEDPPSTLSPLQTHKSREYDFHINDDEQSNHFQLPSHDEPNNENHTLNVTKVEIESIDNIKEEVHYIDNIEVDYDTDYKCDVKADKTLKQLKTKYSDIAKYVTIQKLRSIDCINEYMEKVCLSEKEIEDLIDKRERKKRAVQEMRHMCKECGLRYSRRIDVLRHNTFHHTDSGPPYVCRSCSAVLQSEADLVAHWSAEHTSMMRCTLCTHICRSNGEIKKHLNKFHSRVFICNVCNGKFCTLREFKKHYSWMHGWFTCDYCGRRFTKKQLLENHIRRHHLPPYCGECKRSYSSYHTLESHISVYHPRLKRPCDNRKELAYCVECDKQFPSVGQYKKHLRQSAKHTPKTIIRVPCPDCGKVFTRTNYMNNHYKLVHMKSTKYFCASCNKFFVTAYALRKHTQHVHQKVPPPKDKICDLCGRAFSTNRILANHRRTHTGERPFRCKYCPASFAQQTAMNTHQKTQHRNTAHSQLAG